MRKKSSNGWWNIKVPIPKRGLPLGLRGSRDWPIFLAIIALVCALAWALAGCAAPAAAPQRITEIIHSQQWVRAYHDEEYEGRPASFWVFTRPELTTIWTTGKKYLFEDEAHAVQVILDKETGMPHRADVYHDLQGDGKAVKLWVFIEPKIILLRGPGESYGFGRVPRNPRTQPAVPPASPAGEDPRPGRAAAPA